MGFLGREVLYICPVCTFIAGKDSVKTHQRVAKHEGEISLFYDGEKYENEMEKMRNEKA